mgnify:CR=1 FL=1
MAIKRARSADHARQYLAGWIYHQNGGDKLPKKASDGFKAGYQARKNLHKPNRHKFEGSFAQEPVMSILDAAEEAFAP